MEHGSLWYFRCYKRLLVRDVEEWDREEEGRALLLNEREARQATMNNNWKIDRMQEISSRQKSRMMWLKEGYKNTKFFHKMASARRRINHIGKIRRGGRVVERPLDIKQEVTGFFESLYRGENVPRPKLEGVYFPSISVENQWWLEKEFKEEVEKALAECGSIKRQI